MQPRKGWTPENIETYARFLAENYYIDEDGQRQARRSDADAYEEWKFCAASLGVSRTGTMEVPDEVEARAAAIRAEMGREESVRAAAPALLAILLRWREHLLSANPDFNDPEANELLSTLGMGPAPAPGKAP